MKSFITIVASVFAMSVMAADVPKAEVKPATVTVTAPAAPTKNETKPIKSETKVEAKEAKAK